MGEAAAILAAVVIGAVLQRSHESRQWQKEQRLRVFTELLGAFDTWWSAADEVYRSGTEGTPKDVSKRWDEGLLEIERCHSALLLICSETCQEALDRLKDQSYAIQKGLEEETLVAGGPDDFLEDTEAGDVYWGHHRTFVTAARFELEHEPLRAAALSAVRSMRARWDRTWSGPPPRARTARPTRRPRPTRP